MNRFNLTRFNIKSGKSEPVPFKDNINAHLSGKVAIKKSIAFGDRLKGELVSAIKVIKAQPFKDKIFNELSASAKFSKVISVSDKIEQKLTGKTTINKTIFIKNKIVNTLNGKSDVGKKIFFRDKINSKLNINANVGLRVFVKDSISAVLSGSIRTEQLIYESMIIDVTIKPGQTLRINSNNYTIYLDNEPIIHLLSGERNWIFLDRNIQDMELMFGVQGNLEGTISYTERWL